MDFLEQLVVRGGPAPPRTRNCRARSKSAPTLLLKLARNGRVRVTPLCPLSEKDRPRRPVTRAAGFDPKATSASCFARCDT